MSALSPFILQAQIVPPAGGGSFGLADTTRLENPFQAPMWIDEIRFKLPTASSDATGIAWSSIYVELKLGEIPLTKGFVPISLLGKALNDSDGAFGEMFDTPAGISPTSFTWKLPKPLFVPARELLRPTIYYNTYSGAPARTVTVIYACRPLPKGYPTPKTLQVPWVAAFVPPTITITDSSGGSDRTDQSTPADLYNPWDQELHVQRFIGRLMGQDNDGENDGNASIASARVNLTTENVTCGTLVSAQDSFNNILIRDATPFAHVFNFLDRAWTVNCRLPPKGFYLFTVDRLWTNFTLASVTNVYTVGISMVGWREVKYLGSQ